MFTACSNVTEGGGTNYAALALVGKNGTSDQSESGSSFTGGRTAREAVTIDGVSLEKTGEVYALENTAAVIGSSPAPIRESYMDVDKGVFIPGRNVTLSPFIIGQYEVTQELYKAVMTGNSENVNVEPSFFYKNAATGETQKLRPVENVT